MCLGRAPCTWPLCISVGLALCLALGCRAAPAAPQKASSAPQDAPSAPQEAPCPRLELELEPELDSAAAKRALWLAVEREDTERRAADEAAAGKPPAPPPPKEGLTEADKKAWLEERSHECYVDRVAGACEILVMYSYPDSDQAFEAALIGCDLGKSSLCSYIGFSLLEVPSPRPSLSPEIYLSRACQARSPANCLAYANLFPPDSENARITRWYACRDNSTYCTDAERNDPQRSIRGGQVLQVPSIRQETPPCSPAPRLDSSAAERAYWRAYVLELEEGKTPEPLFPPSPPSPPPERFTEAKNKARLAKFSHECHVDRMAGSCDMFLLFSSSSQPEAEFEATLMGCDLGVSSLCSSVGGMLADNPELRPSLSPVLYLSRACEGGWAGMCLWYAKHFPSGSANARYARRRACQLDSKRCR